MTEDKRRHFINGAWVSPTSTEEHTVINPATEAPVATIAMAGEDEVNRAVAAAQVALKTFRNTSLKERKALIQNIRSAYEKRADDIAVAVMSEMGAPIDLAKNGQAGVAFGHFEGFSNAIDRISLTEELPNGDRILREPVGVVGLITPWNWPIHQICLKVLAAIAAGCTVVLKPSEVSPLSAMIFAEVLDDAGCPPGVFNLISGNGAAAGETLVRHKDVRMVSFTGSTRAGIAVARAAADGVKKAALELGGKSASLVFADADLDIALNSTTRKIFSNSGQNCNAPTRLLVERSIYQEVKVRLKDIANARKVAQPTEHGDHTGPVANATQYARVTSMIQKGIDEGAALLAGGPERPDGLNKGYFVRPTVFADVTPEMTIAREEIFGPVLCVTPFDSEEDAVQIANDTDYGLAAYVHTRDPERLDRLERDLEAGMVFANGSDITPGSPFGGVKKSGIGREGGVFGIEEFFEVKLLAKRATV